MRVQQFFSVCLMFRNVVVIKIKEKSTVLTKTNARFFQTVIKRAVFFFIPVNGFIMPFFKKNPLLFGEIFGDLDELTFR